MDDKMTKSAEAVEELIDTVERIAFSTRKKFDDVLNDFKDREMITHCEWMAVKDKIDSSCQ